MYTISLLWITRQSLSSQWIPDVRRSGCSLFMLQWQLFLKKRGITHVAHPNLALLNTIAALIVEFYEGAE